MHTLLTALTVTTFGGSPYEVRPEVDLPVIGLGLGLSLTAFLESAAPPCLPDCDPSRVNAFDRPIIGNYSRSAHTAADIGIATLIVLPMVLSAVDEGGDGWLTDMAVFAETLAITQGIVQLTKTAVDRPAPLVYDPSVPDDVRYESRDAARSFISGHTATAFSTAAFTTVTFWERNPESPWRWVVFGATAVAASAVGVLKVEAGYHWWTDIIAGAVIGTSIGVLVPVLHLD